MTENRRTSAVSSPKIPPAPPLPLPKQKSRSYFERFVAQPLTTAYGSRPPSVHAHGPDGGPPNPLVPKLAGYVFTLTYLEYAHALYSSSSDCRPSDWLPLSP
jgi:hypothetical protein